MLSLVLCILPTHARKENTVTWSHSKVRVMYMLLFLYKHIYTDMHIHRRAHTRTRTHTWENMRKSGHKRHQRTKSLFSPVPSPAGLGLGCFSCLLPEAPSSSYSSACPPLWGQVYTTAVIQVMGENPNKHKTCFNLCFLNCFSLKVKASELELSPCQWVFHDVQVT